MRYGMAHPHSENQEALDEGGQAWTFYCSAGCFPLIHG